MDIYIIHTHVFFKHPYIIHESIYIYISSSLDIHSNIMMYHYIIYMCNIPLPISLIYNGLYPLDLRSKPQLRCADRSAQESLRCHGKWSIYGWFLYLKWLFSIAMLNYQRVPGPMFRQTQMMLNIPCISMHTYSMTQLSFLRSAPGVTVDCLHLSSCPMLHGIVLEAQCAAHRACVDQ